MKKQGYEDKVIAPGKMSNFLAEDFDAVLNFMNDKMRQKNSNDKKIVQLTSYTNIRA